MARACGEAVALSWRADREAAASLIADELDEIAVLAEPSAAGAALVGALRQIAGGSRGSHRRALLVDPDPDDFIYSYQFGRAVERRAAERGLRLDRIEIHTGRHLDLAAEIGRPAAAPLADGLEFLVDSERDPFAEVLQRLDARVTIRRNCPAALLRPLRGRFFAARALIWIATARRAARERARRGFDPRRLGGPRIRA